MITDSVWKWYLQLIDKLTIKLLTMDGNIVEQATNDLVKIHLYSHIVHIAAVSFLYHGGKHYMQTSLVKKLVSFQSSCFSMLLLPPARFPLGKKFNQTASTSQHQIVGKPTFSQSYKSVKVNNKECLRQSRHFAVNC